MQAWPPFCWTTNVRQKTAVPAVTDRPPPLLPVFAVPPATERVHQQSASTVISAAIDDRPHHPSSATSSSKSTDYCKQASFWMTLLRFCEYLPDTLTPGSLKVFLCSLIDAYQRFQLRRRRLHRSRIVMFSRDMCPASDIKLPSLRKSDY